MLNKDKGVNILSLFDGKSGGQQAFDRLGVKVDNYFASEIDVYATSVTRYNYPNTIFLGDVRFIDTSSLPSIDFLVGGSPCTNFSFAGKMRGMATKDSDGEGCTSTEEIYTLERYLELKEAGFEFEGQSYLFWEYVRIYRELKKVNPNIKFLLENVKMLSKWKDIFDNIMGVEPVRIDSRLLSAQTRDRFYWTNIGNVDKPLDKGLFWSDVQINCTKGDDVMYYSQAAFDWLFKTEDRKKRYKEYTKDTHTKMQMVEASHHKGYSNQRCFGINDGGDVRYIHPIECEILQTIKENYTAFGMTVDGKKVKISRSQRYKMIGNGWTIDVIAHILNKEFN